jgi:hypothetical protein
VHRTTIGAGGRTLVEGPYVKASEKGIRVWVMNRRDDGQVRSLAELATAAAGTNSGLWLLDIGARLKNFIQHSAYAMSHRSHRPYRVRYWNSPNSPDVPRKSAPGRALDSTVS